MIIFFLFFFTDCHVLSFFLLLLSLSMLYFLMSFSSVCKNDKIVILDDELNCV